MVATIAASTTTRMSTITVSTGKTNPGAKVGVVLAWSIGTAMRQPAATPIRVAAPREETRLGEHPAHRLTAAEADRTQQRKLASPLADVDQQRVDDREHGDDHGDDGDGEHEADRMLQGVAGVALDHAHRDGPHAVARGGGGDAPPRIPGW